MNLIELIKNLDTNLVIVVSSIIGVIGLFAVFFLKQWFSQRDTKKTLKNNFHASLIETQRLLKQRLTKSYWKNDASAHDIITSHINDHERAFICLPKSEQISLQSIWDKYKKDYDTNKFRSGNFENEKLKRQEVLKIINKLLKFAK